MGVSQPRRWMYGVLIWTLLGCSLLGSSSAAEDDSGRSRVIELTADTIDAAIAKHDVIFIEFYAPWCGHCKHLAPRFERAAEMLAETSPKVKLAKIDADKFKSVGAKYHVAGFPTLRLFIDGSATEAEYEGPRSADAMVSFVLRSIAPAISSLGTEPELEDYVKNRSDSSPIFLGFGLKAEDLKEVATKYRKKAWFAVVHEVSEKLMKDFDFDKQQALVVTHPQVLEHGVYYGPFSGGDMEDFVRLNLMPLVTKVSSETLGALREDGRLIALGIYDGSQKESVGQFVKMLKSAAPANRPFIFAHIDAAMWPTFVKPFGVDKETPLPTVVIWNGVSEYSIHEDPKAFTGRDAEAQITKLLQDFRRNKLKKLYLKEPSFFEKLREIIWGLPTVYMVVTIIILVWVLQGCAWKDIRRDRRLEEQQQRERLRRLDLEGDIGLERVSRDSVEPLILSRKSEKKD